MLGPSTTEDENVDEQEKSFMLRDGSTLDIPPQKKGGGAKRHGVVRLAFRNPSRQPPEGCAFFPPLVRGIFIGVFIPLSGREG